MFLRLERALDGELDFLSEAQSALKAWNVFRFCLFRVVSRTRGRATRTQRSCAIFDCFEL